MSRQPESRTKTVYQGIVLKRAHRSEYDDNKLRDLARHDARLDHEIKTVERARTVMKKSMEADKQLFIKSGSQNNVKVTKSRQSTNARQPILQQAAGQQSRLVSDTRVKKSSVSDSDAPDFGPGSRSDGVQRSAKHLSKTPDSRPQGDNNNNNNNNRITANDIVHSNSTSYKTNLKTAQSNVLSGGQLVNLSADDSAQNSDSLYDSFLLQNLPGSQSATPGSQTTTASGAASKSSPKSTAQRDALSEIPVDELDGGRSSQQMVDRKQRSRKGVTVSTAAPDIMMDRPSLTVDTRRAGSGNTVAKNSATDPDRMGQAAGGENLSSRRPRNKWDVLATPKHSSPHLSKRAQIEQEFSAMPSTSTAAATTGGPAQRKKSSSGGQSLQKSAGGKGTTQPQSK